MAATVINGITWGHSRGVTPLLAASQRWNELHPGVELRWKIRSLQEFADYPIEKLTEQYDLLIIDHPWVGTASHTGCVLPLDEYLDAPYLQDQATNSVGESHHSYFYGGHQWALAIDAATPAASFRPDLLDRNGVDVPTSWNELLALARQGKVAVPAIPIDLLMNFYTCCIAQGAAPFDDSEQVVDPATGINALEMMREFYSLIDPRFFNCNPIAVAELMSATDDFWYCPFAYCYSNYSRAGFAKHLLRYTDVVAFQGTRLRTTIGGTGLAVSRFSRHPQEALAFAQWIVSGECQRTLYVQHGGQPGHRAAWEDEDANHMTADFFRNLLPVMENGYLRPRYHGYLHFQDHAGAPLQVFLRDGGQPSIVLDKLNHIYRQQVAGAVSNLIV